MVDLFSLLSFGAEGWGDEILAGVWVTVRLALATLPFGLIIGLIIALAKNTDEPSLVAAANIYTTIFRGLPELLTLFIVYYGGQIALAKFVGLFTDAYFEVNSFLAGMIALGLVFSAYASETFLGALRGIPAGQYEGAYALGLSRWKTLRLIILPQLIRLALPGLSNLWLVLLKDTALVSVIALDDLLRKTSIVVGVTKQPFFFYLIACLIYLALAMMSSIGINRIQGWANRGATR